MDLKEFAAKLDGGEMGMEVSEEIRQIARINDIVIIYGDSDDLMIIDGSIEDEAYCYDGGVIHISTTGIPQNKCYDADCPYYAESLSKYKTVDAIWDKDVYPWTYKTDIPHETFEIFEDGEKFCRGIVFYRSNLEA